MRTKKKTWINNKVETKVNNKVETDVETKVKNDVENQVDDIIKKVDAVKNKVDTLDENMKLILGLLTEINNKVPKPFDFSKLIK